MQPDTGPDPQTTSLVGAVAADADHPTASVAARSALVDSPRWTGYTLVSLGLVAMIAAVVVAALGAIGWALAAALLCAAATTYGARRLWAAEQKADP